MVTATAKTKKQGTTTNNKKQAKKVSTEATSKQRNKSSVRGDGCSALAKKSDSLTASQVRILKALVGVDKADAIDMPTLKERVGIKGKYTSVWLRGLKSLEGDGLIRSSQSKDGRTPEEGKQRHYYSGTAKGSKTLEKLEKLVTSGK